jgi:DnaK suppressor protein
MSVKKIKNSTKSNAAKAKSSAIKKASPVKSASRSGAKPAVGLKASAAPKSPKSSGKASAKEGTVKQEKTEKTKLSAREEHIQKIKLNLLKQRESLLNEAESALNELPGQTLFPDLGDQATAETDRNFMLRLRGREQRLLKKIDEAIERIDNGTFGICDDCGNEIAIKRLEARPVTTMCIECKTLQEEEEKLRES